MANQFHIYTDIARSCECEGGNVSGMRDIEVEAALMLQRERGFGGLRVGEDHFFGRNVKVCSEQLA